MRRPLSLLAAIAATFTLATGCGGSGGEITAKGDATPSESGSGGGDTETTTGGSDSGGSDSGGSDSGGSDSGGSGGDLPLDMFDEQCQAVTLAFGATTAAAFAAPEDLAEIQAELDKVKDQIPADMKADIETVSGAFQKLQDEGFMAAGEAMSSPEVTEAMQRIEQFLRDECGYTG